MNGGHLSALLEVTDEPLYTVLRFLVHRDLMDAATHMMEEVGWTPITVQYAQRLRGLNERLEIWPTEPELIRDVLDGPSA